MKLPTVAIALALLLSPHAGIAAIRTIDLTFNGIDWESNGTSASATVRLEFDSLADANPNPAIGVYEAAVTLVSGGASNHAESPGTVTVTNDIGGQDAFSMSEVTFKPPVPVDGQPVNAAAFALINVPVNSGDTSDMFNSDALPTNGDFAAKANFVSLLLTHGDTPVGFPLQPPTVVVSVPEPSAYALMAAGMLALFALRRRGQSYTS